MISLSLQILCSKLNTWNISIPQNWCLLKLHSATAKKTLPKVQHYWTSFSIFWKGKTFPRAALTFSFFSTTTMVRCSTMSQLIKSGAWESAAEITSEKSSCSGTSQSHFSVFLAKCTEIFLQIKHNCISHIFVYL